MTKQSKTLIFFGNEKLASGVTSDASILRSLIEAGYTVDFLVVSQKPTVGSKSDNPEVIKVAEKHGIEVKFASDMAALKDEIDKSDANFGVLAAFGRIVPQMIIDAFEFGIINIHPSLLPEFRGATPIESALLSGQDKTGVSLMSLSAGMDEGPIYGFSEVEITHGMSKQMLFEELSAAGSSLLIELLPKILDGSLQPMEQDHESATYTKLLKKSDGVIDWSKPNDEIERQVRAYLGWPGSRTSLAGKDVTITEVSLSENNGAPGELFTISKSRFGVYCGQDSLEIIKLKPAGKAEMTAQAFLAGNKLD